MEGYTKYNSDFTTGKFFPSYFEQVSNIDVVTYPEYTSGHYNYTGAAIGGFDVSSSSYIVAQSTVDLDYINTSKTRNVYVSAVSKDLSTNKLNKITSYAEGTDSASAPQLVKINDNSFLLLWVANQFPDKMYNRNFPAKLHFDRDVGNRIFMETWWRIFCD